MIKKGIGLLMGAVLLTSILPGLKANAEVIDSKQVKTIAARAQNGWVSVGNEWYYYKNNVLSKGWIQDNGAWYLLDSNDGHMLKGWQQVNGAWYLLDSTYGYMKIGWQQVNGRWYYLDTTYGYMKTGWQKIDGKEYYFWPSEGSMASDTFVNGYYVAKDGSWVSTQQSIVEYSKKFLGTTYVWGGTTPSGFDCSGLTQYVYKQVTGIDISRTTYTQRYKGTSVSYSNLKVGDLVFTNNYNHVGIYVGNGQMIHSPDEGDVVKISNIYNFVEGRRIL